MATSPGKAYSALISMGNSEVEKSMLPSTRREPLKDAKHSVKHSDEVFSRDHYSVTLIQSIALPSNPRT